MLTLFIVFAGLVYGQQSRIEAGAQQTAQFSPVTITLPDGTIKELIRCGTIDEALPDIPRAPEDIEQWKTENLHLLERTLDIPVAFHVITAADGTTGDVSDQQIYNQIDTLTTAYAANGLSFSLLSIDRTANDDWFYSDNESAYKAALAVDPEHTLNIYTTTASGYLGYAYFPWSWSEDNYMHGVVLNYISLPGGIYPYDEGDTGTHEVGHYLGLYHTFDGGCTTPGDYVDDTPQQHDGNNIFNCNETLDTCPSDPGNDPVHNYMNYTDDPCLFEFTLGQFDRVNWALSTYKPSLGSGAVLTIVINEVDADQTGTDSAEFIELYDGGTGNTSLDGYVLVLFNGSDDASYGGAIDLDGYSTDADGYFVVGSANVANVDLIAFTTNGIQNGADAVALYSGYNDTDFPGDTPVTLTNLIDALVYDTDDSDDSGLLVLLNSGEPQINENGNGNKVTESNQRRPDGSGGARNTSTYIQASPTPGATNNIPFSIVNIFSLSDTETDVKYSDNLVSVDAADFTVLGTTGISVLTAAIDVTDASLVHLTTSGITADIVLDTLIDASLPDTIEFYAGITSIALTNTNNPGGTIDNVHTATYRGIVSANDNYNNVWVSDSTGEYNGVLIFDYSFDGLVAVGDEILITAVRNVNNNLTELKNPSLISTVSTGNEPYAATVIPGSDIAETLSADTNPGEKWEGQLVKIDSAFVDSSGDYFYRCTDDGGATYFYVGDNVDFQFGSISMTIGSTYNIVGVVDFDNGKYRINPRDANDVDTALLGKSVLINEVDADQTGTDSEEFIELYDGGIGNTSLDGYVLVLFNGSDDASYGGAIDLDGYSTDADGYFVVGSANVANVDLVAFTTNPIQNGADAVALYSGYNDTDFPGDTPVTLTNLIDALVYDTDDSDDSGLLVLLNSGEPQINENGNGNKVTESNQRRPDGSGGARNTSTYIQASPTPGATNNIPFSIVNIFSLSDTETDVKYSDNLVSVDAADFTVLGTTGISVLTAEIDVTDASLVHLTTSGITADIVLDTLIDASLPDTIEFYAGITSIALTNTNNPGGTIDNVHTATYRGIVSANDNYNNVWVSDSTGEYNGVLIFDYSFDGLVAVGDEILITAVRNVNNNLTELKNPSLISTISTGNEPYAATVIPGSDIDETLSADTNPGEKWEGQLVKIDSAFVDSSGDYFYRCTDDGGTTYFYVGDNVDFQFGSISMTIGSTYNIVGVVDFDNGKYRINPRDANDVDGLITVVNPLSDISVDEDSPDTTLGDLNTVFYYPGGTLTFSHTNSDTTLVEVIVIGDTVSLSFYPDANGDAELVFTATSTSGDSISDTVIVTVLPVNDAPQSFDLVGPVNDTYIEITPDNLNEVLTFSWGVSIDIDGDSIVYSLLGTDGLTFLSVDTVTETSIVWFYEDLEAAIDSIDVATGTWMIIASDDELNTEAGNGPFTLTIDAAALSVDKVELMPDFFALHPNYPNPFNPVTTIAYDIPEAADVRIDIYDILGQKVRTLVNSMHEAAFHKVVWNSRDDYGKSVPSGMYIYRITATDPSSGKTNFTKARKLVMIK